MGTIQSYLSSPTALAIVVIVGAVTYVVSKRGAPQPQPRLPSPSPTDSATQTGVEASTGASTSKKSKKKKQQDATAAATGARPDSNVPPPGVQPNVVPFPPVIPGSFETTAAAEPAAESKPKSTKSKKKKGKKSSTAAAGAVRSTLTEPQSDSSATAPESVTRPAKKKSPAPKPSAPSTSTLLNDDGPWTRVEPRKRATSHQPPEGSASSSVPQRPESDAGVTSITGTSSSVADRTEDDARAETSHAEENKRTLAERLQSKPRKTGVEDMLETPDIPNLSRVMRVQPRPDEKPAAGFSWADYEDVDESRLTADDADGEDEGGWVVKSTRRPKPSRTSTAQTSQQSLSAPETLTKKQRQAAAKREAQKAAKAEAEAERQAKLAQHKRELEKAKIAEQLSSKGKKPSGGMTSYVNEKGQLVWD